MKVLSNRRILLLFIVAAVFQLMAVAHAEEGTQEPAASSDIGVQSEEGTTKAEEEANAKRAKAEKREAAKKKKRSMQSCLTLVRSYYGNEDEYVQGFVQAHPTKDKNRLLSKILSQMMIKCSGLINE